jgi:hypothetical protein
MKLSPGDDLIMSTMYSLLNFIAVTSKELTGQGTALRGEKAKEEARDDVHIAFGTFTDNEKRILGISTICVVTHLALEVKKEEVCWRYFRGMSRLTNVAGDAPDDLDASTTYSDRRTVRGSCHRFQSRTPSISGATGRFYRHRSSVLLHQSDYPDRRGQAIE